MALFSCFLDHFLIFASNEGIYSLNLDDTNNIEMVQVGTLNSFADYTEWV